MARKFSQNGMVVIPVPSPPRPTVDIELNGNPITINNCVGENFKGLSIYGKSVQDGTPTPDAPVEIESAGNTGSITVTLSDGADQSQTLTYPTPNGLPGIPVESGGNYTDKDGQQWICDEVDFGRGKYVQRVKQFSNVTFGVSRIPSSVTESTMYETSLLNAEISGYNFSLCNSMPYNKYILNTNVTGFYVYNDTIRARFAGSKDDEANKAKLATYTWLTQCSPVETNLTPEQIDDYKDLTTYEPVTTVYSEDNIAGMKVKATVYDSEVMALSLDRPDDMYKFQPVNGR